jgi:5-methylcytosine-specific restriction enzyme subunit McrC
MLTITLKEYQSQEIPRESLSYDLQEKLCREYSNQIEIDLIADRKGDRWRITAQGYVGYIQVSQDLAIFIEPKTPIKNVLAMLEYTPEFKGFKFPELAKYDTLQDFLNSLAELLADRVLEKCRRGLYRSYISQNANLEYVRGRIDIPKAIQKPWQIKMPCQYQENTHDNEDNQIIFYTLHRILRSQLCTENTQTKVHKAFHALQGYVNLYPFIAANCRDRHYSRLNQDYRYLHLLCQFFLDRTAPTHNQGQRSSFSFLIDMASLYENFVAEWLKRHLPSHLRLYKQYSIQIGLSCAIDLVIKDIYSEECKFILDTKYKIKETVSSQDLHQVRSYAIAMQCPEAILIYPQDLAKSLDHKPDAIHTRSLTFALDNDLDQCGQRFLANICGDL